MPPTSLDWRTHKNKCVSNTHTQHPPYGEEAVKPCAEFHPLLNGNISVGGCMPTLNHLKVRKLQSWRDWNTDIRLIRRAANGVRGERNGRRSRSRRVSDTIRKPPLDGERKIRKEGRKWNKNAGKIAPKFNIFRIMAGAPIGGWRLPPRAIHLRKLFRRATFPSLTDRVPLPWTAQSLQSFTVDDIAKIVKNATYLALWNAPKTLLENSRRAGVRS